jgi:hypothetical protein
MEDFPVKRKPNRINLKIKTVVFSFKKNIVNQLRINRVKATLQLAQVLKTKCSLVKELKQKERKSTMRPANAHNLYQQAYGVGVFCQQ